MSRPKSPGGVRLLVRNGVLDGDVAAQEAVEHAWSIRFADVKGMLAWAQVAVELAKSNGVKARAHAHLGNAHRVNGDYAEARHHLDIAEKLYEEPDALLLEFRASLYECLGLLKDASGCLQRASRLRALSDCKDSQAKVLILNGRVLAESGRHAEAVGVFLAALETIESDRDLLRSAVYGLTLALANTGQVARGLAVFREAQQALEEGDVLSRLRASWLLGRIGVLCGADEIAVANLEEARAGFSEAGLAHETCLVTLDLAVHEARRERVEAALELLKPIPELLTKLGVPAHAATASAVRLLIAGRVKSALAILEQVITAVET